MAVIHILDQHTAELIAAGEVVERPASVVKELTENAIDAGASVISIAMEHGGISMIEIADNGSGIDAEFVATAFIRHATSKIERQEDLENIHTLGFRGEALASVASVARVDLLTKTPADEYACLYRIYGGVEQGIEAAARPVGTTITVRDLFYNTPARMKFLKKDTSEGNYIADVATQLALSHPEISFKLIRDGKVQFQTPGDGALRGAAYAVLSREFAHDLAEVNFQTQGYAVTGLVTPPKSGRASRGMQYFFVNGRFVKNRTMMAALEAAYKGAMMQGKFPGCVLSLTMPADLVDVNVHPAKTEVRFAREKDVFDAVYHAVKSVLLAPEHTEKTFSFGASNTEAAEASAPQPLAAVLSASASQPQAIRPVPHPVTWTGTPDTLAAESPIPYKTSVNPQSIKMPSCDVEFDEPDEEKAAPSQPEHVTPQDAPAPIAQTAMLETEPEMTRTTLRFVGEVFDTYIVTQCGDAIYLIDKHAAHERAIYESLAAAYGNVSSQMLLCPVTVQLSAGEKDALLQNEAALADSGLEVEDFGGKSVVVRAVPADIVPDDVEDLVIELASRLENNPRDTKSEKTEWVLHSIACRAAIKAGDKTHAAQLLHLAEDVLDGKIPPFCPHGRPITLKLTKKELEIQFGRQG
ncbi:MAG: DNA mismatch repair endonuclease MutL [Ruthenibacterium sp.]